MGLHSLETHRLRQRRPDATTLLQREPWTVVQFTVGGVEHYRITYNDGTVHIKSMWTYDQPSDRATLQGYTPLTLGTARYDSRVEQQKHLLKLFEAMQGVESGHTEKSR
jgi:hypothetical protein